MINKKTGFDGYSGLRRRAEGITARMPENPDTLSPEEARQQLIELQVHQVDMERQEETLKKAKDELEDRVRERTSELERRAEQLSNLACELTQAEISERKRLAQFLHDDLQQLLVGAKFSLSTAMMNTKDEKVRISLEQIRDLLNQSIAASRTLTSEISPPILYDSNLVEALRWVARWMEEKHGLAVDLHLDEKVDTRFDIRVLLFQAVRELLFNIVKHSGVDRAEVRTARWGIDQLTIEVRDNGKGFDSGIINQSRESTGGFGLFSIHERLQWIGGRCEIVSTPSHGAVISLFAPLARETRANAVLPMKRQGVIER